MGMPLVGAAAKVMSSRGAFFVFGAVASPLLMKTLEPIGQASRTLLKGAIKSGIVAGQTVQGIITEAKAGISDIAAEAKADLNKVVETAPAADVAAAAATAAVVASETAAPKPERAKT